MKKYILLSALTCTSFFMHAEESFTPQQEATEQKTQESINSMDAFYQTLSTEEKAAFDNFIKAVNETEASLKNAITLAQIKGEQELTDIMASNASILEQLKKFTGQEVLNIQITVPVTISKEF